MKPRVLVAAPLVGDAVERLRAVAEVEQAPHVLTEEELLARVAPIDGLVSLLVHRIDPRLLARAPRLRVVGNHAVGVDNVDLAACAARGVVVTNTPGVLTEATADLAFALLLDAARRVTEGDRLVRSGAWQGWEPTAHLGRRVHGATLGIVGFGRIGRAVAARGRGFSMRVLYTSRSAAPPEVEATLGATRVSLEALLAEADFVSLHAPLDAHTRGLLGAAELARLRRGAVLVNTARGGLVDEDALVAALRAGHLVAALDVYRDEPRVPAALRALPNVVLAPHVGSADVPTRAAMATLACEGVRAVLEGRAPEHRVS